MCKGIIMMAALLIISLANAQQRIKPTAKEWVNRSIEVMGGNAWNDIKSFAYSGSGYQHAVEQSERPHGPYLPMILNRNVLKNLEKRQAQYLENASYYNTGNRTNYVIDGTYSALKMRNGSLFPWIKDNIVHDELTVAPEFILQDALHANDLHYQKDTVLQQVPNVILGFTLGKYPVRLFLSKETDFLTGVEITKPYGSGYLDIWGDSKKTTLYSFWNMLDKNIHYPLQSDTYVNGWYYSSFIISNWKLNAPVGGDSLSIPDSIRTIISALDKTTLSDYEKAMNEQSKELAPGVWYLPGPCNTTVVEQPDGLVVIEAGLNSGYGDLLLAKVAKMFPGKKIKAIASTSDAWLHIGGIRPFAALPGITIYHPERNTSILNRLLSATYTSKPDALAKSGNKNYRMKAVEDSMTVGTGTNKIVFYTFKTETGERMMMAYFPNHSLLYASDLFQPKQSDGKYWQPHYTWEVYTAIQKRNIQVKNFYAMHAGVQSFAELEKDFK